MRALAPRLCFVLLCSHFTVYSPSFHLYILYPDSCIQKGQDGTHLRLSFPSSDIQIPEFIGMSSPTSSTTDCYIDRRDMSPVRLPPPAKGQFMLYKAFAQTLMIRPASSYEVKGSQSTSNPRTVTPGTLGASTASTGWSL